MPEASGEQVVETVEEAEVIDLEAERWRQALQYRRDRATGDLVLTSSLTNAVLILLHGEGFNGCWGYDAFTRRVILDSPMPEVPGLTGPKVGVDLEDHHTAYAIAAMGRATRLWMSEETMAHAIVTAARQRTRNSLTAELDALPPWDGVERLHRWLYDYLGADGDDYTCAAGRWWMISAMARAYQPGCQADIMLVLEGRQGCGKSTACSILGGQHYLRKLPSMRDYERAAMTLAGKWVVEVGELDALRGAAATQVKDFLSMLVDDYRPPWGRFNVKQPRTCVFIGTTNEGEYLSDPTGGRRFLPVKVRQLDRTALIRDRNMLLAEAREAYRAGGQWHPPQDWLPTVQVEQEARYRADEWEDTISKWLQGGRATRRDGVSIGDVLFGALEIPADRWDQQAQIRVGIALRRLGMEGRREGRSTARVRRYYWPT